MIEVANRERPSAENLDELVEILGSTSAAR